MQIPLSLELGIDTMHMGFLFTLILVLTQVPPVTPVNWPLALQPTIRLKR